MTAVELQPTTPATDDDEICHVTRCEDFHGDGCPGCARALCGADLQGATWTPQPSASSECVVCLDLERIEFA